MLFIAPPKFTRIWLWNFAFLSYLRKKNLFFAFFNEDGDVRWPRQVLSDSNSKEPNSAHLLHLLCTNVDRGECSCHLLPKINNQLLGFLLTISSRLFSVHQVKSACKQKTWLLPFLLVEITKPFGNAQHLVAEDAGKVSLQWQRRKRDSVSISYSEFEIWEICDMFGVNSVVCLVCSVVIFFVLCVKTMRRLLKVEQAVQLLWAGRSWGRPEPDALPAFKCK